MKYASVRFNKPFHTDKGSIYTNTNGYKNNAIPTAFAEMLKLIPVNNVSDGMYIDAKFYPQVGDCFYAIEEKLALAIQKVVQEINKGIQSAYDAGKEDGKAALILLNNGDISLSHFDKK